MPVIVSCRCGKRLQVAEEHVGKKVRCPGCQEVLTVPPLEVTPMVMEVPIAPAAARASEPASEAPWPRIWKNSSTAAAKLPNMLVFTGESLYWAQLKEKERTKAEEAIRTGTDPREALGKKSSAVPLSSFHKVRCTEGSTDFRLAYANDKGKKTTTDFVFANAKARDEAFRSILQQLGSNWEYTSKSMTPGRAMLAPIGTMVLVIGLTILLVALAIGIKNGADWDDGSGKGRAVIRLVYHILKFLGPVGTGIVGALGFAATWVWLIMRVQKPPVILTLEPAAE